MANQDFPVYERKETAKPAGTPDFQSSTQAYAESQNSLSAIGAKVAQTSSNQMAVQLGYEEGKNPHGDLMPSITEFDKNFTDSYHQQANATLTIQGQKLLDDAHVEMSKPNRLTPELIDKTHEQLAMGLGKIAQNAPTAIRGQLQAQFDSSILNQITQYKEKMIGEQREDDKNSLVNSMDLTVKNILENHTNGDTKGGDAGITSVERMANNALANKYITPEQARVYKETAIQAGLDGKFINEATQAEKAGKLAEFEKNYADKKLPGTSSMTNEQHRNTGQAITTQLQFLQGLRQQDENLKSQQMLNTIAERASTITGAEWTAFANSVSPLKAEEVKFRYIQALKKNQSTTIDVDSLIKNYSNPEVQASADPKVKNGAFLKQVDYAVLNSHKTNIPFKSPTPISRDEAEVMVAAQSGAVVPVFQNMLKNKLHSGNPAFIESAAQQIHALQQMQAGHAIDGLNDQDHALYTTYESLRDSRDPVTAARDATAAILNQDPATQQANKEKWANLIHTNTANTGLTPSEFALNEFKIEKDSFANPAMAQVYGADILKKYSSLYQIANGDENVAKTLTQRYIDQNYGETRVNGGSFKTMHPIEKVLGYSSHDVVPYIQQDVIDQFNKKLAPLKDMYAKGVSNEYWETLPQSDKTHGIFKTTYDPVKIKRHMKTVNGEKTDTFNVMLMGNDFDWDVAIETGSGMRNLFQVAPALGIVNYAPDTKSITARYNKDHNLH